MASGSSSTGWRSSPARTSATVAKLPRIQPPRSEAARAAWVADGTPLAAEKLARVLVNDPGTGVMRHVDAGYERAREVARERGLTIPMLDTP